MAQVLRTLLVNHSSSVLLQERTVALASLAQVLALAVTCQQVLVLVDLQLNATETFGRFRVDVLHVGHLAEPAVHLWAGGTS